MSKKLTTIEKLAKKHFEVFGESPEWSFWGWLDSIGVNPNEEALSVTGSFERS